MIAWVQRHTTVLSLISIAPLTAAQGQVLTDTIPPPAPVAALPFLPRPGTAAGSGAEDDFRTLQLIGVVPVQQWSVRALGPRELDRMSIADTTAIPRSMRSRFCQSSCAGGRRIDFGLLPVEGATWFNSARPHGINDGPVWTGRGLTAALSGGVHARLGPLSAVIAPIATWSQNQGFPLEPTGYPGALRFGDAVYPEYIDHPQRFGDGAHARLDAGESTLRFDLLGVAAGVSTASQWWGPMATYPYLLSNNAGGFPHVFVGTSKPVDLWIGRLHARVMYGALAQSSYSPMPSDSGKRLASGLVAVFVPRGLPGFEVGGGRFYHSIWPDGGLGSIDLAKPFEGLLKASTFGLNPDGGLRDDVHNQLASVFVRLTLPASGVEIYGEFGREDHNADLRDFWLQPDNDAVYGLGLRRAWRSGPRNVSVFSVELMNARISHIDRARPQVAPYLHGLVRQGHTHRGQPLGSGTGGRSGDALAVSFRRYGDRGRWTYSLSRHGEAAGDEGSPGLARFIAAAERSVHRGSVELTGGIRLVQRAGYDEPASATNLNVSVSARWIPVLP